MNRLTNQKMDTMKIQSLLALLAFALCHLHNGSVHFFHMPHLKALSQSR